VLKDKNSASQSANKKSDKTPFTSRLKKNFISNISKIYSIRVKLIAAFLSLVILIPILGITSYSMSKNALEDTTVKSTFETLDQANKYLGVILSNVENISRQISKNSIVTEFLSGKVPTGDSSERLKVLYVLEDYIKAENSIFGIIIISSGNRSIGSLSYTDFLNSQGAFSSLNNAQNSEWYKSASENKDKPVWYGRHSELDGLTDGNLPYSMFLATPITDSSDNILGMLVIDLKASVIEKVLGDVHIGPERELHLISPEGRVSSHLGSSSSDSPSTVNMNANSELSQEYFIEEVRKTARLQGSDTVKYNGKKHLMIYNKIEGTDFVVVGLLPLNNMLTAANSIRILTIVFACIAFAIAALLSLVTTFNLGRSVEQAAKIATLASSGNLNIEIIDSKRKDEVGVLIRSLYQMIKSMRDIIQQTFDVSHKLNTLAETVSSTSQQVSASSREISDAIQAVAEGASSQALNSENSVQKMDELALDINEVTNNSRKISDISIKTLELTKDGLNSMDDLNKKTAETNAITESILSDIEVLNRQSKSIGKIIKVINGIADQTNLLALNATIEAARAGESGKGFAVVANQVRKLAEQSMSATREISQIIKTTQELTEQAVERAITAEQLIKSQTYAVEVSFNIYKKISVAMSNLAEHVNKITQGMEQIEAKKDNVIIEMRNISDVAQQAAATSQEVNAASEEQLASIEELSKLARELNESAIMLSNVISKFKVN